jgi:hypothetical protein
MGHLIGIQPVPGIKSSLPTRLIFADPNIRYATVLAGKRLGAF